MIEKYLVLLAPYVPVIQTIIWILFIVLVVVIFRKQCVKLLSAICDRIEKGCSFKAGIFEVGADLNALEKVAPEQTNDIKETKENDWDNERRNIYEINKGIFLTHIIKPSRKSGQEYDIFIYLIRHKTSDLKDVEKAEFFFGHMWNNRVFEAREKNGMIGVATSAYGPFLCTCCVYFKDGSKIKLNRYIDFEMGRIFKE